MVQNLTDLAANAANVAATSTTNDFNYQVLAVLIAGLAFFFTLSVTLLGFSHNVGKQLGRLERIEESINQKYSTTEKIQQVELNIQNKSDRDYVDAKINELKKEISNLNIELKVLKEKNITHEKSNVDDIAGFDQKFIKIESQIDDLNTKLKVHQDGHAPRSGASIS